MKRGVSPFLEMVYYSGVNITSKKTATLQAAGDPQCAGYAYSFPLLGPQHFVHSTRRLSHSKRLAGDSGTSNLAEMLDAVYLDSDGV